MRKNVITKSKKQISLEERIAREQEKLQELNAVMEARKQKLEGRLRQLISAASGSFDVVLDDGKKRTKYALNRSYHGLYIPTMHWREIENFSSGAVCMVLASEHYDETDYIYEYDDFIREVRK